MSLETNASSLFPELDMQHPEIVPGRRVKARAAKLLAAPGNEMQTVEVDRLEVEIAGIVGDYHYGHSRKSGSREPWYPRGTEMCNERQLTLVAADEMAHVAGLMGIERIEPEWIGANMVIEGLRLLSLVPPRTQLFFAGGVTLRVDGANVPCKFSGASIASHYPDRDQTDLALAFPAHAKKRRGLVVRVEKPGVIEAGEEITVAIPDQWIYRP